MPPDRARALLPTTWGKAFVRLAARRGKKRAMVAVGHNLLVIAYHLLAEGTSYYDLGGAYVDERDRAHVESDLRPRTDGQAPLTARPVGSLGCPADQRVPPAGHRHGDVCDIAR
jgi:hypothetical protein